MCNQGKLKTERLGLILTHDEKEWVRRLAKIEGGLSQAALIRRLIHLAVKDRGLETSRNFKEIEPLSTIT